MNFEKMSEKLQEVIMHAVEICKTYQHTTIDTIQMLKAIFENDVLDGLFKRLNIDKIRALQMIDDEMSRVARSSNVNPQFSNEAVSYTHLAFPFCERFGRFSGSVFEHFP